MAFTSRAAEEHIFAILSHVVCGPLSQRPQELAEAPGRHECGGRRGQGKSRRGREDKGGGDRRATRPPAVRTPGDSKSVRHAGPHGGLCTPGQGAWVSRDRKTLNPD